MRYANVRSATFVDRPNRFVAHVDVDGRRELVHVKNTGRCRELLLPGAEVYLTEPGTKGRKTRYDLVVVRRDDGVLFNIDSQAPNKVVGEWLQDQGFDAILPEYGYGGSRMDFYLERGAERHLMEVKGCTLEVGGVGFFPDAPTERGVRHLRELMGALREGYGATLAFVIAMEGVREVRPNAAVDPVFAGTFEEARRSGVDILMLPCHLGPDTLEVATPIAVPWA